MRNIPLMTQRWRDLLFLHWRFPPQLIQKTLPPGLTVETYDQSAWVGIVPFRMEDVRLRGIPLPGRAHAFPELNLRTYVRNHKGENGVWFYSLDAASWLAVRGARSFFHLNYQLATMAVRDARGLITFSSQRKGSDGPEVPTDRFSWRTPDPQDLQIAGPGSLEEFLVERYSLFSRNRRTSRLYQGKISHEPYRFAKISGGSWTTHLFALNGLPVPDESPSSVLAAPGFTVRIHGIRQVDS